MAIGGGGGHVQSVIASGVLAVTAVIVLLFGAIAHLISANRRLVEDLDLKVQHLCDAVSAVAPEGENGGGEDEDHGDGEQRGASKIPS